MRNGRLSIALAALLSVLALAAVPLRAQEIRGSILGRITDPSGAALPGARVTVTNEETNTSVTAQSNEEGNYNVPFLPPGRYTVTTEANGFKKAVRGRIIVQVQDNLTLNFSMAPGDISESVSVTAETPLLQKASAGLGQVITREFLDRLPLIAQSPLTVADMAPGVISSGGGTTSNAQNDISINAGNGQDRGNDVTIDGVPNVSARQRGLAATIPMPDAVQEFKVNTTLFDASLGHTNGGSLSVTTRSGTNALHGSIYAYLRNRALDANSWTNNRLGLERPSIKFNSEGGTIGGPVRFPKSVFGPLGYDGRDRSFFFAGFERTENARQLTRQARVPTALERAGNFSETQAPNGRPITIHNPFVASRPAFPNATIPQNLLDPVGLATLAQYPLPNLTGALNRLGVDNWAGSSTFTTITKNTTVRFDQQLSARQRVYVRFSDLRHNQSPTPNVFPGAFSFPTEGEVDLNSDNRRNKSVAVDDTITFSPTFVGSLRYGFTRANINVRAAGDGLDPALLKLPPIIINNQFNPAWPTFDINRTNERTPSIGSRPRGSVNNIHSLIATFNKLQGAHSFKFGLDYRTLLWNEPNPNTAANGFFRFDKRLTRSSPTSSATEQASGSALASVLLGLPATTAASRFGSNPSLALQNRYFSLFFQDDWKVSSKLTLNLGLRWEMDTPFTERYDRLAYGFDPQASLGLTVPSVTVPGAGEVINLGTIRGGLLLVNQDGQPRRQGKTDWNNLGPRVSFAYSVSERTVIRAGYAIFFASGPVNIASGAPGTLTSYSSITQYIGSSDNDQTVIPGVNLSNPFPNGLKAATGGSLGPRTDLGDNITFVNPDRVLPYSQQWQLSVQRELPWQTLFEVSYVGTHVLKTLEDFDLNEAPDRFSNAPNANTNVPNPFFGVLPSNSTIGLGSTIRLTRLRRAFPQFNNITMQAANTGRLRYNGLQTRLQKRLSGGLSFVASYAFSKAIEYTAGSLVNERHYRTVPETDFPHIFRFFSTYDLPIGRGRALGGALPAALDHLVGGWSVTWVSKFTSGEALGVTDSGGRGRPIPTGIDPYTSGEIKSRVGDPGRYLNPAAFRSLPDEFAITPEPVRYGWLRGPSAWNHSLSLFKTFTIFENLRFELRGQFNNVFNSPQFDNPQTNLGSLATFGQITGAGGNRTIQVGAKIRF